MKKHLSIFLIGSFLIGTFSFAHATEDTAPMDGTPPALGSTPPPEVLKFLQDLKRQYGADTVALVSWLIDATNHSGSVLTSSVKVDGPETKDNTKFLVFLVDTGLILNEQTTDQNGRLLTVWDQILTKAFLHMDTLRVPADGVRIDLLYHHKSFPQTDDLVEHVDEPGPIEEAKFYIPGDPIRSFMKKELSGQQLLSHTQVFVDGKPVILVTPDGAQHL
jgi:hypothetical protein